MLQRIVLGVSTRVDFLSAKVQRSTKSFIETRFGQGFLSLAIVGPLTFIPTVYGAWTADNIDALRTITWPMMTVVNISVFVGVCHCGDWRMRLSVILWTLISLLVWLATIVR
jgi:hypothetical protein